MAIIRLDIITECEYYHGVFTDESAACNAMDEYMQRNEICGCSMSSKEDMIAVNAELAEHFDDAANFDNYAEWHELDAEVVKAVSDKLNEGDVDSETLLRIAELLDIDLNELFEGMSE